MAKLAQGRDALGNVVGSIDPAVLAGIDDFVIGFLAYEQRIVDVLPVARTHHESVLAQVYAGFVMMFSESLQAPELAQPYLAAAQRAAGSEGSDPREQSNVALLSAWMAGDVEGLLRLAEQHLQRWPRDLVVVKLVQYLAFNRGDSPAMLRVALQVASTNQDVAWWHGMLAFAYEQCHLLTEAEEAARAAIALRRKEPWAQHALAHVMLTQGRVEEGTRFLESVQDTWVGLSSFMHTHLWWHLAVFYLARGRFEEALDLYHPNIWGIDKQYSQDQIGAVQLLTRLELAGVDVGDRWQDLATHIAERGPDTAEPFLALLYLIGLTRAGHPEAAALRDAILARASSASVDLQLTWSSVAAPAAEGLWAWAQGDWGVAAQLLGRALPSLVLIGGSHAQRDLFQLIHLDALWRSGHHLLAQQQLEQRRRGDPDDLPTNRVLATLYERLGLPVQAAEARARVQRWRADAGARTDEARA